MNLEKLLKLKKNDNNNVYLKYLKKNVFPSGLRIIVQEFFWPSSLELFSKRKKFFIGILHHFDKSKKNCRLIGS